MSSMIKLFKKKRKPNIESLENYILLNYLGLSEIPEDREPESCCASFIEIQELPEPDILYFVEIAEAIS